jgi:hypothetical protein
MKRIVVVLLLVFSATSLFAINTKRKIVEDVIRMSQAGVGEDAIIEWVMHTTEVFEVTADDVIAMTRANVSKRVIEVMIDEAAARKVRAAVPATPAGDDRPPFYPPWLDPHRFLPRLFKTSSRA